MRRLRFSAPLPQSLDLTPQGFLLSEAALYSFYAQDVYEDVFSFCSAIPDHLKSLFLIPVRLEPAQDPSAQSIVSSAASRLAGDAVPSGDTPEGDLFGYRTFNYLDGENTVPSSDPGSIFDIDGADGMTHHQEMVEEQDINVQVPSDTSYMSDVDVTDSGFSYPYRTDERPLRHSSDAFRSGLRRALARAAGDLIAGVVIAERGALRHRVALKPEQLEVKAPGKVKDNAESCSVSLVSYDKRGRVFTFDVNCGNGAKNVRASLTDLDHVAMTCDCAFWRYNGPEYHAKSSGYMLGLPHGSAAPPDIRDPDRKYYLCKHTYAVLKRLDEFVSQVVDDDWDGDEQELMQKVDESWDQMSGVAQVPIEEFEDDVVVDWDEPGDDEVEEAETDDVDGSEVDPDAPADEDVLEDGEGEEDLLDEDEDEDEDAVFDALNEDSETEELPEAEEAVEEKEEAPEEEEMPADEKPGEPPAGQDEDAEEDYPDIDGEESEDEEEDEKPEK